VFWWEQRPWVVIFSRDRDIDHLLDAETGAILFREPIGMACLLADPVKAQLPIGV
jgi:hypothetical protein